MSRLLLLVILTALLGCAQQDLSPPVVLTDEDASRAWKLADSSEPLGEISTDVGSEPDGSTTRTSWQSYRLRFPGGNFEMTVTCKSSCKPVVVNPSGPEPGCGVGSGCDPDGQGDCTAPECPSGCIVNQCVKTSTGLGSVGLFAQ